MGNGAIIIQHYDFDSPSRWCYQMQEIKKLELGAVTYGITSIPNEEKRLSATI
jgi:hypothetical protein